MLFVTVKPKMILKPIIEQDLPVNLTTIARNYYGAKIDQRRNDIVEVTSLNIPLGILEGNDTHITPELILTSTDSQAIMEYAQSFFKTEETDFFFAERNIEYDMQDM